MQSFLVEVGARLSDVFGADSILWVEGKTEEICFPELIHHVGVALRGIQILGVLSTDEVLGKHAKRVIEVYSRLSSQESLFPPALAFVFDLEGKSEADRIEISKISDGKIAWLPRRMYENYLIDVNTICDVLNEEDIERQTPVTATEVLGWLSARGGLPAYWPKQASNLE